MIIRSGRCIYTGNIDLGMRWTSTQSYQPISFLEINLLSQKVIEFMLSRRMPLVFYWNLFRLITQVGTSWQALLRANGYSFEAWNAFNVGIGSALRMWSRYVINRGQKLESCIVYPAIFESVSFLGVRLDWSQSSFTKSKSWCHRCKSERVEDHNMTQRSSVFSPLNTRD